MQFKNWYLTIRLLTTLLVLSSSAFSASLEPFRLTIAKSFDAPVQFHVAADKNQPQLVITYWSGIRQIQSGKVERTDVRDLSKEQLAEIKKLFNGIDMSALASDDTQGLDGSTWVLSTGGASYRIWSPEVDYTYRGIGALVDLGGYLWWLGGVPGEYW